MSKKKILITGASGFIGRNLSECLCRRFELSTPSHQELDLMSSESVQNYLDGRDFDAVIHCALVGGYGHADTNDPIEKNVRMFMNIARCRKSFGRMIQFGSGAEYDKSQPIVRAREEDFGKRVPKDDYGSYKYECSKYIEGTEGIICLRPFGCFGKHEDYKTRFISNAICKSLLDLPITIANRNVIFSYLYACDLARIVEHFIENGGRHKFYNVVPNETVELLEIAKMVNEISGKNLPIIAKNPGMGPEYTGDNSRLREELPGFKFTPLKEAISVLYSWYKENKSSIDAKKLL